MQDLGTLGGLNSQAVGINNAGQVVGWSDMADGSQLSFIWDTVGGMRPLDLPNGMTSDYISGISKDGEIVGSVTNDGWTTQHALVWRPDADGDGLLDTWEEHGYDSKHDGVMDVNLPAMGANKNHKDIFVQTDYMVATDHTHQPTPGALQTLMAAFNKAPITNPDGTTGIHIHIDAGPNSVMDPVTGATWGSLSQATALAHANVLGSLDANNIYVWTDFNAVKAANFSLSRLPIFRYVIFAHDYAAIGNSGISNNLISNNTVIWGKGASDLIVSLGEWTAHVGTDTEQAGTLMHELGHNFGLQHGGNDSTNNKPNYLSIMNYLFQIPGLRIGGIDGTYDYSEFPFPNLDETNLNEPVGLNGNPAANSYGTRWYCGTTQHTTNAVNGPIDWNCNGVATDNPVTADINQDGVLTPLSSQTDWDKLVYPGGLIGSQSATFSTVLSPN